MSTAQEKTYGCSPVHRQYPQRGAFVHLKSAQQKAELPCLPGPGSLRRPCTVHALLPSWKAPRAGPPEQSPL